MVFGAGSVNATIAEKKIRFTIYEYNYIDFTLIEYPEVQLHYKHDLMHNTPKAIIKSINFFKKFC